MTTPYRNVLFTVFLVLQAVACQAEIPFRFSTVALSHTSGEYGPSLGDSYFVGFRESHITQLGTVTFPGVVATPSGEEADGVWTNLGSRNTAIALAGDDGLLGPGLGAGISFSSLRASVPGDGGTTIVPGVIQGIGVTDANAGLLALNSGAENRPFTQTGVDGPLGTRIDGLAFQSLGGISLAPSGEIVLQTRLTGPSGDAPTQTGIWKLSGDERQLLFLTGETGVRGPGLGPDSYFANTFASFQPQFATESGDVVILANAKESEGSSDVIGLWRNTGELNAPLALSGVEGSFGPSLESGVTFDFAAFGLGGNFKYDTNKQGHVLLSGDLSDGRNGFWRNLGSGNEVIAITDEVGDLGPGLGPSVSFSDLTTNFFGVPTINENGASVFKAFVSDGQQLGLWLNDGTQNRPIALTGRTDELGPDLGSDVAFSGFNRVAINEKGTVFFTADLNPGVPSNRLLGLWAYKDGEITKLARVGELFDVDPTAGVDERQVRFVQIPYEQAIDSDGGTINDRDEVVVRIGFEDGTQGIFVARLVPEPSSASVLVLIVAFMLARRCSRNA